MRSLTALLYLTVYAVSSIVMLYQAYTHALPTLAYYFALALYVAAIAISIPFATAAVAVTGVLSFFLTIRLMFYVGTRFLVFPFGDPYGQFGVLEVFAQLSHAPFINPTQHIFDQTNYLSVLVYQYSNWPGFQILTLTLSRTTSLPLLDTAIAITLLLDLAWFGVSYCLLRKILSRMTLNLPNPVAFCLAIVICLPSTAPLPSYFKYDFPATVFMLLGVLLLLRIYDDHDRRVAIPLLILSTAIVITHSLTAFAWVLMLFVFVVWSAFTRSLADSLPSHLQSVLTEHSRGSSIRRVYPSLNWLFGFMLVTTVSWSTFYAAYLRKYVSVSLPKILASISLSSFSVSRLSTGQASLTTLTPGWILELLSLRDRVWLGLLLAGVLVILLRPSIMRKVQVRILILTVAAASLVSELSGALSFGDRAFELFAPLLGILIVTPLVFVGLWRPRIGKVMAVAMVVLFMVSVGIGFWGSSYAPTGMYDQGTDTSLASGRPLSWPVVASFMSFSGNQSCILTNEIYATSLSVPVSQWNITKLIGSVMIQPGCLAIVYNGIYSAVNSNVSSFGFGEPYSPYQGFSPGVFYSDLNTHSDRILATDAETVYYSL